MSSDTKVILASLMLILLMIAYLTMELTRNDKYIYSAYDDFDKINSTKMNTRGDMHPSRVANYEYVR